jgi:hypothetical protein
VTLRLCLARPFLDRAGMLELAHDKRGQTWDKMRRFVMNLELQ